MRQINNRSEVGDLPDDLRSVIAECVARWEESGVLYDPGETAVVLVEAGDTVEALIGYSRLIATLLDPAAGMEFDWMVDHPGCYEAGVVLGDDGCGFSLIVPKTGDIPSPLLAACQRQATAVAADGC